MQDECSTLKQNIKKLEQNLNILENENKKIKSENLLNTLKVQEEYKLKGKEADNKQEI